MIATRGSAEQGERAPGIAHEMQTAEGAANAECCRSGIVPFSRQGAWNRRRRCAACRPAKRAGRQTTARCGSSAVSASSAV